MFHMKHLAKNAVVFHVKHHGGRLFHILGTKGATTGKANRGAQHRNAQPYADGDRPPTAFRQQRDTVGGSGAPHVGAGVK